MANGGSIEGQDPYWILALRQLLRSTIDTLLLAGQTLTLPSMYQLIISAPQTYAEAQTEAWTDNSFCGQCLHTASVRHSTNEDLKITISYWTEEFPRISERTRSSIVSMFTTSADMFLRGTLRTLFGPPSQEAIDANQVMELVPELSHEGAIIILDLPIKRYGIVGKVAQSLYKFIWQQAVERRPISDNTRPVFLWADENQYFITNYDADYQQTARSSRAATVFLTQNVSNYHINLGQHAEETANSILGNLATKIFHANSDVKTNKWASELFGDIWESQRSLSLNMKDDYSPDGSASLNSKDEQRNVVEPRAFTLLKYGGSKHHNQVEAIIHQAGRLFHSTNSNYIKTAFTQQ